MITFANINQRHKHMRKIILFTFLYIIPIGTTHAEGLKIPLQATTSYEGERGHIRHAPPKVRLPVVEIDGNTLYIKSLQSGSNITVTLEDMDGNTIYNVATIAEANMSFLVTQDLLDKAHTIIINIDEKEYLGEI